MSWRVREQLCLTLLIFSANAFGRTTIKQSSSRDETHISIEEFLAAKVSANYFNGSWFEGSRLKWWDETGSLITFDVNTSERKVILDGDLVRKSLSPTARFVSAAPGSNSPKLFLFKDSVTKINRHTETARYFVLDAENKNVSEINPCNESYPQQLQYATWIPGDNKFNLVYVWRDNIYLWEAGCYQPIGCCSKQVTNTTDKNIKNGVPDWVFEEEILMSDNAIYSSDDGQLLAYARFNDTEVHPFYITRYDGLNPNEFQYPYQKAIKYPKPGSPNPQVDLFVLDTQTLETQPVYPPEEIVNLVEDGGFTQLYLYAHCQWIPGSHILSVLWLNRVQNYAVLSHCKRENYDRKFIWSCYKVLEQEQSRGWIGKNMMKPWYKEQNGKTFLQVLPKHANGSLTFRHLATVERSPAGAPAKIDHLTSGNWTVTQIDAVTDHMIHFTGTGVNQPGQRHLYSLNMTTKDVKCVTCGGNCTWSQVKFSPDQAYYIHTCKGPKAPKSWLRSSQDHSIIIMNLTQTHTPDNYLRPIKKFTTVEVEGGFSAPVALVMHPNMDRTKKHPLIVNVYGGPGDQQVKETWDISSGQADYMVMTFGVVCAMIDGRGTAYQSDEYLFANYRNLGSHEIEDQIYVTKKLLQEHEYLDPDRTGIWGWSYGGYATLMALVKDTLDVFKCYQAVAPPTDWLLYDTLYTERYMGTPHPFYIKGQPLWENERGYNQSSLLDKAEAFRGKKFSIHHGLADDNVHAQNTLLLVRELQLKGIPFQQNIYPDEKHGLSGVRPQWFHSFLEFWKTCLLG